MPRYDPASFRDQIERLIREKRYSVAVAYVRSADPQRQVDFDKSGYLAIGRAE